MTEQSKTRVPVLLVDDVEDNLELLARTLRGTEYELHLARDGQSAVDLAQRVRPAVVLLDIMMPGGLDGYDVCRRLNQWPEGERPGVIFLSALEGTASMVKGLKLGGTLFLQQVERLPQKQQARARAADAAPYPDVRIIASAGQELVQEVTDGRFDQGLLQSLGPRLSMPPLRSRSEDISTLANHYMKQQARRMGRMVDHISPQSLEQMCRYRWPGNINELESFIARHVILAEGAELTFDPAPSRRSWTPSSCAAWRRPRRGGRPTPPSWRSCWRPWPWTGPGTWTGPRRGGANTCLTSPRRSRGSGRRRPSPGPWSPRSPWWWIPPRSWKH